jgi:preprotein translocase subunit SecY
MQKSYINVLSDRLVQIIRTKEIRDKIFFSLVILIVFRLLAAIPVVGITADAIKSLFSGNGFGDVVSTVSGGVLETASLIAIGLAPYINASVMLQLLGSVIPKLEQLKKDGTEGRKIISMWTRFLTVPMAILQSFAIYATLRGYVGADGLPLVPQLSTLELLAMSAALSAGAILMMWMAELVAESGIGQQGSSYLIFLGIIAGVPGLITQNFQYMDTFEKIMLVVVYLIIIFAVIFITESEKRIKVQYSRRVRTTGQAYDSFIPLKLTQFGVMPVIFAMSLFTFPILISQFLIGRNINPDVNYWSQQVQIFLQNPWVSNIGQFLLIIAFSFFYLTVVFNTDEQAEQLQKNGAFIPGIRPGKPTSEFLRKESFRLTIVGSIFLGFLAILPNLLQLGGVEYVAIISGTGFLIAVGTLLDMKRQIGAMVVVKGYDRYL